MKFLKSWALAIYHWFCAFGFYPIKTFHALRSLAAFFTAYRKLGKNLDAKWPIRPSYPCLDDRFAAAGTTRSHYFHQDFYVARRIFAQNPRKHVDVGSRIDGFVTHVATFRPIEVIDIRPLELKLPNITFSQADFVEPMERREYCDSLSCLHVIEHFGLGRYGDPVDGAAWQKGLHNLAVLLAPGGRLYLSTPIGRQRIEFNAHRVFSAATIIGAAREEGLLLDRLSVVDDGGGFQENVSIAGGDTGVFDGLEFGCGIFEFLKPGPGS